ncbi:hypothetical protein [Streptomyces sp. NPDC058671]|uniref:hypothetical protein n=1 Tax=Streptomyces sp. NPDC058671 TaxID=3346590 RepID=UPI003651BCB8
MAHPFGCTAEDVNETHKIANWSVGGQNDQGGERAGRDARHPCEEPVSYRKRSAMHGGHQHERRVDPGVPQPEPDGVLAVAE